MHRYRSHTCADLRASNVGESVRLSGWVHRIRDHGGLLAQRRESESRDLVRAIPGMRAFGDIASLSGVGMIAGFAAEIAGPFPAGSLVDDASMSAVDYANSLVFTTASLPGSRFVLGENSGWTCPDGSTYDACAEEPECVVLESAACLE